MLSNPRSPNPSRAGLMARRRRKTSKEERICPVCAQAFKKADHLARHMRSHTKEKPFNCPICNKAFARQDTMLRHSRSHPAGSNPHGRTAGMFMSIDGSIDESMNDEHENHHHGRELISHTIGSDIPSVPVNLEHMSHLDPFGPMARHMMAPVSPPNSSSIDKHTPNMSIGETSSCPSQITPLNSLFSLQTGDAWRSQASPEPPMWDFYFDPEIETLLTGEDFDLDAVNMSLLYATSDYVPADTLPGMNVTPLPPPVDPVSASSDKIQRRVEVVRRKWHTFSDLTPSGQLTPDVPRETSLIDESYRKRLAERLQQRVQHGILPSTPFLDLCIQAYFSKFHPLFPIVHMPTFRPSTQNSVLLLSVCSAGSLFIGSSQAISHGISMFERLNKAILSSWDTYFYKSTGSSLVALQASMIGQNFGLMMGRPKDLMGIETWHGSIVAWARKARIFGLRHSPYNFVELDGEALNKAWMNWIQIEVNKRIALGLYIHDAELARLHHHEPLLRHSLERLPQISSNDLFTASSAEHWKALMLNEQSRTFANNSSHDTPPPATHPTQVLPGDFALCGMLESISAMACEIHVEDSLHASESTSPSRLHPTLYPAAISASTSTSRPPSNQPTKYHLLLTNWYTAYHTPLQNKSTWPCLMMLWHSTYITLHADINALECAAGREGYDGVQKYTPYAWSWVRSADAKRCVLHALLIQKNFESLPAGAEPAIYVPMCLYYCGFVWASFLCFGGDANRRGHDPDPEVGDGTDNENISGSPGDEIITIVPGDILQFAELRLLGADGIGGFVEQMGGLQPRRQALSSLFRIIDLLQRISHWKIAQNLAATLSMLVEETQDLF